MRRHSDALREGSLELLKVEILNGEALKDIMDKNPPTDGNQVQQFIFVTTALDAKINVLLLNCPPSEVPPR